MLYFLIVLLLIFIIGYILSQKASVKGLLLITLVMFISFLFSIIFIPFKLFLYFIPIIFIIIFTSFGIFYYNKEITEKNKKKKLDEQIDKIYENQINENEDFLKEISNG